MVLFTQGYFYKGGTSMFFTKQKQRQATWTFETGVGKINVAGGSDIERQIQLIGLTEEDLDLIHSLQPYLNEKLTTITDYFYSKLEKEKLLVKIINDHSSTDRLKRSLQQHLSETFSGVIDQAFIDKRKRIAHMHVKIGLPTKWYIASFQLMQSSIISIIEEKIRIET